MQPLYVYSNDVTDWVIASSEEDARLVMREFIGDDYDSEESGKWLQEDDEEILRIWCEGDLLIPPEATKIMDGDSPYSGESAKLMAATCRQWADANGRTVLCSTEY